MQKSWKFDPTYYRAVGNWRRGLGSKPDNLEQQKPDLYLKKNLN